MGFHIGLLIMAALQYLAPDFIKEGRLCWLRSPLYIVNSNKKDYFYFTDAEYNKRKIKGITTRAKGLGALSAEQAHVSMFTDEYQRLDVLKPDKESFDLFEALE